MQVPQHRMRDICEVDVWLKPWWTTICASPDRQHVAQAVAVHPRQQAVALDGKYRSVWDSILVLSEIFTLDSEHLSYGAGQGSKVYVVLDERRGLPYDELNEGTPIFSPDGTKLAYAAKDSNSWKVVMNQQETATYDDIIGSSFVFSEDSRHFAYHARRGGNWFVVVDGVEFGPYEKLAAFALVPIPRFVGEPHYQLPIQRRTCLSMFSSDGKHVAYVARTGSNWFVVKDGVSGKYYDKIVPDTLSFFPHNDTLVYVAVKNGRHLIIVDTEEIEAIGEIDPCGLALSPARGEFAYIARRTSKGQFVVWRNSTHRAYTHVSLGSLTLSPDGNQLAYAAKKKQRQFVIVIDGVEIGPYIGIMRQPLSFTQDGQHLAFVAGGAGEYFVVLDGHIEIGPFPDIVRNGGPIFISPKLLRFVAIEQGKAVTVEYDL